MFVGGGVCHEGSGEGGILRAAACGRDVDSTRASKGAVVVKEVSDGSVFGIDDAGVLKKDLLDVGMLGDGGDSSMHEFTEVGVFDRRVGDFQGGVSRHITAMVGSETFFNKSMGLEALGGFDVGIECM